MGLPDSPRGVRFLDIISLFILRGFMIRRVFVLTLLLTVPVTAQTIRFLTTATDSTVSWDQTSLRRYESRSIARQEGRTLDESTEVSEKEIQVRFSDIHLDGPVLVRGAFRIDSLTLREPGLAAGTADSIRSILGAPFQVFLWQGMPLILQDQQLPDSTKTEYLYRAVDDFYPPTLFRFLMAGRTMKPGDSLRIPDTLMYASRTTGIPLSGYPRATLRLVKTQGTGGDARGYFELLAEGTVTIEQQGAFPMTVEGTLVLAADGTLLEQHLVHTVLLTETDVDDMGNPVDLESTITLTARSHYTMR